MGLLTTAGPPMRWGTDANNSAIQRVSMNGVMQFIEIFKLYKDLENSPPFWGEEVEHQLVRITGGEVKLSLNAAEVIEQLEGKDPDAEWRPEYGSFMVESVPAKPYTLSIESLCSVEDNILNRYKLLDSAAGEDTISTTLVSFPLMGVGKFTTSDYTESPYSQSIFVPDDCINQSHPRFVNLTTNIRLRRGRKVCVQVPLYVDKFTLEKTVDKRLNMDYSPRNVDIDCIIMETPKIKTRRFGEEVNEETPSEPKTDAVNFVDGMNYFYAQYFTEKQRENVIRRYDTCPCPAVTISQPSIYMDCMAFGMGLHCLQVTMQMKNINEARRAYDQLAILCPVFLAITSSTPFQKGLLCDSDVRWITIAESVDDRRKEEVPRIIKSRYDSISAFLAPDVENLGDFNDIGTEINMDFYEKLTKEGIDHWLAHHVAHLFIRDPLVVYENMIEAEDAPNGEHFENIQSTNWQTVRFKPPPLLGNFGWRVEFRVMDVMITPFENAAFSVFVVLLTRAIIHYNAQFYTKLSIVDANTGVAHRRNPTQQLYTMRKDIFAKSITASDEENEKMTIDEIFNGKEGGYFGLIPLVRKFVKEEKLVHPKLDAYLDFISKRASGVIPTDAQYLRNFIITHPDYAQDSRITPQIAFDLVDRAHKLAHGEIVDEAFLPISLFNSHKRRREE